MGINTNIEWTDSTLNFWEGCSKVSQGCKNCYADAIATRYGKRHWGPNPRRMVLSTSQILRGILKRQQQGDVSKNGSARLMVFVNDISDTFEDYEGNIVHPDGSPLFTNDDGEIFTQPVLASPGPLLNLYDLRAQLFSIVENTPSLDFQILTKRPENILKMVPESWRKNWPKNAWIGTSVEDQKTADERIPHLLQVPAAVRFLSCEPLLGPVQFSREAWVCRHCGIQLLDLEEDEDDVPSRLPCPKCGDNRYAMDFPSDRATLAGEYSGIHWVICGGESGPNARPMHPEWARSLRDQCQAAEVPFFFKQSGEYGTRFFDMSTFAQAYRSFRNYQEWVNKSEGWVGKGTCIDAQGKICKIGLDFESAAYPVAIVDKLGKKKAGRKLDNQDWSEFPR